MIHDPARHRFGAVHGHVAQRDALLVMTQRYVERGLHLRFVEAGESLTGVSRLELNDRQSNLLLGLLVDVATAVVS